MANQVLTQINGIGPSTAQALRELGFTSVGDVAAATVAKLTAVPGFGPVRARAVLAAVKEMASPPAAAPAKGKAEKGKKKPKSKKTAGKKGEKKEKKKSDSKKGKDQKGKKKDKPAKKGKKK